MPIFRFAEPEYDVWQKIAAASHAGRPILLWGMGNGADKLIERLSGLGITPAGVYASPGFVRGQTYRGYRVEERDELLSRRPTSLSLLAFASRQDDVISDVWKVAKRTALLIPDLPVSGGELFDLAFFRAHRGEIEEAAELFEDARSLEVYSSLIRYKLSGDLSDLLESCDDYSLSGLLPVGSFRRVLDAGAYDGDTARDLLSLAPGVEEIVCCEPDPKNYAHLLRYRDLETRSVITPLQLALSDRPGSAFFSSSGNRNATFFAGSHDAARVPVRLTTVDEVLAGTRVDYIKYDVEGMESAALAGSLETIARCRPCLSVSLYHRSEDLFAIPLFLHRHFPDYTFLLRRKRCLPAWETELFALPKK